MESIIIWNFLKRQFCAPENQPTRRIIEKKEVSCCLEHQIIAVRLQLQQLWPLHQKMAQTFQLRLLCPEAHLVENHPNVAQVSMPKLNILHVFFCAQNVSRYSFSCNFCFCSPEKKIEMTIYISKWNAIRSNLGSIAKRIIKINSTHSAIIESIYSYTCKSFLKCAHFTLNYRVHLPLPVIINTRHFTFDLFFLFSRAQELAWEVLCVCVCWFADFTESMSVESTRNKS